MAAVPVTITGVLFDKYARTSQLVTLMGEAVITGLGVGGGPMPPGEPVDPGYSPPWARPPVDPGYGVPERPPHIWGGGNVPMPSPPIYIPPAVPPGLQPPTPPQPGDPTTPVPPPPGSGGWPVQPVTPPPYIVVQYPGIGPVTVAPPAPATSEPKPNP